MSVTTTQKETLQTVLDEGNASKLPSAVQKMKLGTMLTPVKKTFTSLSASDTHDITDAAHGSCAPILAVVALRATAVGTAALGARFISDIDATASATVAKISDDGKTIKFEGTVTGFILEYLPRSNADMTAVFANV